MKIETQSRQIIISVIIVNYNGLRHLEKCLTSLEKQTFIHFEVIFVDNGSTDGSVDYVKKYFPDIQIVELDKNKGFCRGNNWGLKYSSGDFIALLNNDTQLDIKWLEELDRAVRKKSDVGIFASCLINYYSRDIIDTAGDGYDICGVGFKIGEGQQVRKFQKERYVFGACAGAALYSRAMINEIGFLDNRFFAYGEDLDLSFRAKLAGYKCLYVPKAKVYHKINQTSGKRSDFILYQTRRNIEYTYFKNMPFALLLLTLPFHLIYNLFTFFQAVSQKRIMIYIKAKVEFLRHFGEILSERRIIQKRRRVSIIELISCLSTNYLYLRIIRMIGQ